MMIRNLDTARLRPLVEKLCSVPGPTARNELADFAAAHGVPIGRM